MKLTDEELSRVLNDLNYLPPQKLETAKLQAKTEHSDLYETLVRHDYLSQEELGKVIAYHFQLPFISLDSVNVPAELLNAIPEEVAQKFQTIPYKKEDTVLHIATGQPRANDLFDMLTKKLGMSNYRLSYATDSAISSALHLYKQELQGVFDNLIASSQSSAPPVASLVDTLFEYAYDSMASDIHIEPLKESTVVRFRIDGVLHDEVVFSKKLHAQIVTRIKVLAKLRTDEHLSAQDGRLGVSIRGKEMAVRISVVPLVTGEKVVMRLLAHHSKQFSLNELGMTEDDMAIVREGFNRPFGMILSTGPTGSGKTTTIYAVLKILNSRDRNIATIEDPVEYELEGTNQVQANTKTNLTFTEGLRSLLRQDPDVLFVGEIRDEDTAGIAINAAMTGHLVLSTMHTNDAVTTLPRLVDMDIAPYLVASTVNIIIGQRLVRQICNYCKSSIKLTKSAAGWQGDTAQVALINNLPKTLFVKHFGNKASIRLYHGVGCEACRNTGYQGRIGIFEVLEITPKLAELINSGADSNKLTSQAVKDGMTTMLDDGLDKVIAGSTTLSEIMRVTKV